MCTNSEDTKEIFAMVRPDRQIHHLKQGLVKHNSNKTFTQSANSASYFINNSISYFINNKFISNLMFNQ